MMDYLFSCNRKKQEASNKTFGFVHKTLSLCPWINFFLFHQRFSRSEKGCFEPTKALSQQMTHAESSLANASPLNQLESAPFGHSGIPA